MHSFTRPVTRHLQRAAYLFVAFIIFTTSIRAQQTSASTKSATISGRITFNDGKETKPARGASVALFSNSTPYNNKAMAKATCDAEGRYKFTNLPVGKYRIYPLAPAFVPDGAKTTAWYEGKSVSVSEGENIDSMDFNLTHGGVITGRVTDENTKPVIAQRVTIYLFNEREPKKSAVVSQWEFETNDLGIYRVYGLAAGRYLVSVGDAKDDGSITIGGGNTFFARAFYPNARDFAQAKAVEITAGGEATDIDITVPAPTKTFTATGRVVDADTDKPVANANILQGSISADGKLGGYGSDGAQSDEDGNFRIKGLVPGRHGLFASTGEIFGDKESGFYSETTIFEISDADASDLEIKLHRGATINGTIVIEGNSAPAIAAKIPQINLMNSTVSDKSSTAAPRIIENVKPNSDGGFQFKGVRPGKVKIQFGYPPVKGLTLLRVERDGVNVSDGMEVAPREEVNGVRVIVAYGAGSLRGQVNYINGTLPTGAYVGAKLNRIGGTQVGFVYPVDSRGQFSIEGLTAGDYEVTIEIYAPGDYEQRTLAQPKQTVSVKDEGETKINVTLDLSKTPQPETKP